MRLLPLLAVATAAAITAAAPAGAQGRPDTPSMSCRSSAAIVRSQGAVVLGTGGPTFDRFVANRSFCEINQFVQPAYVQARDTPSCFVGYRCRDWERDFFDY